MQNVHKNKIILAENYQKDYLLRQEINRSLKKGITNLHIQTISSFLNQQNSISNTITFMEYYTACNAIQSKLTMFSGLVSSFEFVSEIISFHKLMQEYSIQFNTLPQTTDKEKELYLLLQSVNPIVSSVTIQNQTLNTIKQQDLSHIQIQEGYLSSIYAQNKLNLLLQQNATLIPIAKYDKQEIQAFRAVNKRQEVEAIAQYIIQSSIPIEEVQIVVCNANYTELIKQIFTRYHIPYQFTYSTNLSKLPQVFLAYLSLFQNKTIENLIQCIQLQCFSQYRLTSFLEYITQYDINLIDCLNPFQKSNIISQVVLSNREINELKRLEAEAEVERLLILPIIKQAIESYTTLELLQICFQYTAQHQSKNNSIEEKYIQQIQSVLQDVYPYLTDAIALFPLLDYLLSQIQVEDNIQTEGTLTISKFSTSYLPNRTFTILLGGSHDAFIPSTQHTGIFDESYMSQMIYPTQQDRYEFAYTQQMQVLHLSKHLIVSYSYGDYQGKGKEMAFELEEFLQEHQVKVKEWPLLQNDLHQSKKESLSIDLTKLIFLSNQYIYGSVSSIETYFKCNYQYFLKYGLQLYTKSYIELDITLLGTILHHIVETLIQKNLYPTVDDDTLMSIIQSSFSELFILYPNKQDEFTVLMKRLFSNLKLTLQFLESMEKDSYFKPVYLEYPFEITLDYTKVPLILKGKVDRIDVYQDFFRILDYKSSDKTLSEKKFTAATQLQLLTYLCIMEELLHKKPVGAYYFSLKSKDVSLDAMNYNYRTKECSVLDDLEKQARFLNENRLSGWTVEWHDDLDQQAKHIKGLSYTNQKAKLIGKPYNITVIQDTLKQIYTIFVEKLLSGEIEVSPSDHACEYCEFLSICQNKKQPRKDETVVTLDTSLKHE